MGHPALSGRFAYRTTESAVFPVVGDILGGLLAVWAKVKAPARRKRRETERRRIRTSQDFPSTGFLRTPRLYSCDAGGSTGVIASDGSKLGVACSIFPNVRRQGSR